MMNWKTEGTDLYRQLPGDMYNHFGACEPLRQKTMKHGNPQKSYKPWKETD